MEKHGLEYKDEKNSKGKIETKLKETPADDAFGPVNKFLGGLGTAYEAINNIKEIMCASVIAGMNDEYIDMLIKIRDKAQNIEGHGFEKTDLINALNFEIDYKEWYGSTITFQQGFEIYDELTSTTDLEQYGANALSRKIWEHTGEELIIKTFSNPEKILTQFSSAQLAAKVGWGIADKAFDLSNKNNLYYKAKCYGVLEEILLDILEEEKNNLPSEFVSASMDGKKIEKYHSIASQYDLAFKMYKYVEGKGCKTYADYEKAFMMTEKSDNIVDRVFQLFGNGAETVVRLLINRPDPYTTIYDLLTGKGYESSLEKTYAELLKNEINRLYNSLYYTSRAKSVEKWVCCGDVFSIEANTNGNKLGSEYVKILFDTLYDYKKIQFNAVRISCPVEVKLYDENDNYLGKISESENSINNTDQVITFRNDIIDSNYLVYPTNYRLEIVGLDDGKMNIWGTNYSDGEISRMVMYLDIMVDDDYVAEFDISSEDDSLKSNNCTLFSLSINDVELTEFDKEVKSYVFSLGEEMMSIPTVTAIPANINANVEITQATSLTGTESERTATITVTAEDGVTQTIYKVTFEVEEHTHTPSTEYSSDETGHWYACSGCTEKVGFERHTEDSGTITIEPTETTEGVKTFKCTKCGWVIRTEPIAVLGHIHTPATKYSFDETGHWYICSGCTEKIGFETHIEDIGTVTKEPTETAEGEKTYKCTKCGYVIKTESIPKKDPSHIHSYGTEWKYDSISHWHECSCGDKADMEAHISDSGTVTKEPTETAEGERTYKCTKCGYVIKTEAIPKNDPSHTHSYGTEWKYDHIFHWHECSCGDKADVEYHISDSGTVTKEPTETTEGERIYKCTKCGYVLRTESLPKKAVVPFVPAPVYPVYNLPSSPYFSTDPVTASGKSHTRQKLTLKAETSPDSIKLSWNKISGAKKYTVYIYRTGKYEKLKDTAGTSFVFKKPVNGKTYRFLVRYFANGRPSAEMFSGKVTVTVYLKPVVTAYPDKNSIKLSWKPVSGAEKYAVYRYKNGRGSKIYETENTYAVIKNLKSGAKYSYVVRAYVDGKWTQMTKSDIVTAETKME